MQNEIFGPNSNKLMVQIWNSVYSFRLIFSNFTSITIFAKQSYRLLIGKEDDEHIVGANNE